MEHKLVALFMAFSVFLLIVGCTQTIVDPPPEELGKNIILEPEKPENESEGNITTEINETKANETQEVEASEEESEEESEETEHETSDEEVTEETEETEENNEEGQEETSEEPSINETINQTGNETQA